MAIGTLIKIIQDIMRKDVGVDGDAQRISQIVWLLFLKIFDDKEQEWELTIPNYKSPLQNRFKWTNWAKNPEGITGDELINFVNNDLFPSLKKLSNTAGVSEYGRVIGTVFEDAYNYMKSGTLLRQVINAIEQDVDFNSSTDRHMFNDIYEKILADLQSAGNAGEYYTPRAVTQFIVNMINPKLGESVMDPACGTGGFLTCAIDHLKKQVKTPDDTKILSNSIHGIEKKPLPHMLAMTNMMLHGIDVPTNIRHTNTLGDRPYKDYGPKDRVDIIITNPPFGGIEENGIESNFLKKHQTRETADLFMALIMHLLKHDTGRAAVVLPDGFLFGEGVKTTLKRELLEEFNLHTIIRLPKGVFSPYTSINTNILFFEKGGPTKDVWFFEHPYPDGYKSYSRSNPLTIEEFDLEKEWWGGSCRKERKVTKNAWKVSVKDLEERNYNFDCKNPHFEEIIHQDPVELMGEYEKINKKLLNVQQELKSELMQAFENTNKATETISNNFNDFFSNKQNITKLKQLTLQLAMQGKLVPQDPNNQPASELLKKIEKEKKANKVKSLEPIKSGSIPYVLPNGWQWVYLNDFGVWKSGSTPSRTNSAYYGGDIPWVKSGEVKQGLIKKTEETITQKALDECSLSLNPIGSVLVAMYGANIGEVGILEVEATTNQAICACQTFSKINNQFLKFLIDSLKGYFISQGAGAAQPNISRVKIINSIVPLPPFNEQEKIVEKINQLMALCDELEKQIESSSSKQTELLNAIMSNLGK